MTIADISSQDSRFYVERAQIERAHMIRHLARRTGQRLGEALATAASHTGSLLQDARLWLRRRAVTQELARLDDRMLKDIGLYRGDIPWVAEAVALGQTPDRAADTKPAKSAEIVPLQRPQVVEHRRAA